jgi:hypothetical protein
MKDNLMVFFDALYNELDDFYLFLFRDEEYIDKRYIIKDAKRFISLFCSSLNWLSPQGISISKI